MTKQARASVGLLKGHGGERSEPEGTFNSPTEVAPSSSSRPDPEVPAKAVRRRFSAAYKLRIVKEADAAAPGTVGALLRHEGLYSSLLTTWRRQLEHGELESLAPKKRGPEPKMDEPTRRKMLQLERENQRLVRRLKRAEQIIDIQKKISDLLGIPMAQAPNDEDD